MQDVVYEGRKSLSLFSSCLEWIHPSELVSNTSIFDVFRSPFINKMDKSINDPQMLSNFLDVILFV